MTILKLIKILHVIFIIAWMAGMLYLPRLFVYHVKAKGAAAKMLATMEVRLLRMIMTPAMLISIATGLYLMLAKGYWLSGWMHAKLLLVFFLLATHGLFAYHRKQLLQGKNKKSELYFRLWNEVPTLLLILIVTLVIAKPF